MPFVSWPIVWCRCVGDASKAFRSDGVLKAVCVGDGRASECYDMVLDAADEAKIADGDGGALYWTIQCPL